MIISTSLAVDRCFDAVSFSSSRDNAISFTSGVHASRAVFEWPQKDNKEFRLALTCSTHLVVACLMSGLGV